MLAGLQSFFVSAHDEQCEQKVHENLPSQFFVFDFEEKAVHF